MKRIKTADVPAIQRMDRAAFELAEERGIPFSEAWLLLAASVKRTPRGLGCPTTNREGLSRGIGPNAPGGGENA